MIDQDIGYQMDRDKLADDSHKTYTVDEFEVRIMEPEKSSGRWETRATIPMQNFEHALTLRMVTLLVSLCKKTLATQIHSLLVLN